jgi:hypothetical protein
MARDQVAAERGRQGKRKLQVDTVVMLEDPQRRPVDGLQGQVEAKAALLRAEEA